MGKRPRSASPAGIQPTAMKALRAQGVSLEVIAGAYQMDVAEVERILEQEETHGNQAADGDEIVQRLLKDPNELCRPISFQLMEHPVVAADGITYEHSWVEEQLKRVPGKSPMTGSAIQNTVLNPNQDMKSRILSFKEETLKEILSVVPKLAGNQALQLLQRGEDFVRQRLPDASARKQLGALLLLRLKLPGEHGTVAKEVVSLLIEFEDGQQLQEAFATMEESDIAALLSSLDEAAVNQLHVAMIPCDLARRGLVDKELARRLASRLNEERLKRLWQLLQGDLNAEHDAWARAAACLLSAQMGRIEVDLQNLSLEVLVEARNFLDDEGSALSFAKDFFTHDLGVSTAEQWPVKSSAPILHELAGRLSEEKSEEKLQLLVKAHGIDESHPDIRVSLYKLLHAQMLGLEAGDESALEGLFLKLALQEGSIPEEVLPKLTLSECHLSQASPKQLMNLFRQLAESNQRADGARVAVFAARGFRAKGQARLSEEGFLKAFALDRSNQEAAEGLATAVTSAHKRCEEVEDRCEELEYRCEQLEKKGSASDEPFHSLEAQCQALQRRCADLESQQNALQSEVPGLHSSIVWDLSSYDFSGFRKDQCQESEKFQLGSSGVTASLRLYPKGHSKSPVGQAGLFFWVDKPAVVKWTWQSGSGKVRTEERDFSKELCPDGTPGGCGWRNFMPSAEANGSITLRILSVQLPGSKLRFS